MKASGWSSTVIRQAVISTLLMLAAIAVIAVVARTVIERQQRAATIATIDTDIAGLVDGMERGGLAEMSARINDRISLMTDDGAQYRLADTHGVRIAGNLGVVPLDPGQSQSGVIQTPLGPALARATRLRGGYTLTVARTLQPNEAVLARLMAVLALASVPAAIASLLVGVVSARRFSAKVAELNQVFGRFEAGDQSARTVLHDRGQELGRLSIYIDSHLARIEKLIATQRQISENIAHELRTPLGHLDSRLLNMMWRNKDAAVEEELHAARDDIRSIVSLFDTLLDLALAEAKDNAGANATTFDLSDHIADLADLYAPSAEEAGLQFTARITPAVTMRGEPMAMTRAVANLLDNAFKFTAPGAHVRLTVAQGPYIMVEDDGPGIAPQVRDSVFERFCGSREQRRGHGLGLALVKVIALRHGLTARFEDAMPGARFILEPAASS